MLPRDPLYVLPAGAVPKGHTHPLARQQPISLKHLINFGKGGRNKGEKEEAEKLLKGGNFVSAPARVWDGDGDG